MPTDPLHLAVALDGAGWHPAAWRADDTRPHELLTPRYWTDLAQEAERGLLDFITIEDSLALQSVRRGVPDDRVDRVRGRLDAVLVGARVSPVTSRIGIVPVATTTHIEPFHASKAIATLDYVSMGRAGVQVRVSGTRLEAEQFGRRQFVGSPATVVAGLEQLQQATGADELVITTITHDHADRARSYRLLVEEWRD